MSLRTEKRFIKAGDGRSLWLNQFPFRLLKVPTDYLERSFPALTTRHEFVTRAAMVTSMGHEAINLVGAEFTPNTSNVLTIRVPLETSIAADEKTDREQYILYPELAQRIMTALVIQVYHQLDSLMILGSGELNYKFTGCDYSFGRGGGRLGAEAIQMLPLLWFDNDQRSDWEIVQNLRWISHDENTETVTNLMNAMRDSDWRVRSQAALDLGWSGNVEAVPQMIEMLKSEKHIPYGIVHALADIGDSRAVPALLDALARGDQYENIRLEIIRALGRLGDTRAVEPLLTRLNSTQNTRQETFALVDTLGQLEDQRVVPALIPLLESDYSLTVLKALGRIGGEQAFEAVMKAAEQSSFDTRLQFLRALGEFSVEDERIWRLAVDTMEQIPRGKYSGPASAASVLMELDPHRAETLLRERFQIADQTLQGELLVVLSRGKNPDTLHFVMQELGSQPDEIRKQCIQGFGQAKTIEALPMLIDVVLDETASREVRMAAIRALEDIGSRDAVSALLGLVDHDDTFLVAMAIQSLGKLKDERAIPTLIRKLDDSRHAYYFGYYVHTWAEMTLHKFEQTSEITSAITAAFRKRNNLDGDK